MTYQCDIPGFEACFVEYASSWSVNQVTQFYRTRGADFVALVASKTAAVSLVTVDGATIDTPESMTIEQLGECDLRLFQWWKGTADHFVTELERLGEQTRRSLYLPQEMMNASQDERRKV